MTDPLSTDSPSTDPLSVFDYPPPISQEIEQQQAVLLYTEDSWYINFPSYLAHDIGTRSTDVKMVKIINETSYLDSSHDGEMCMVNGQLSIVNEQSTFVLVGVEF